MLAQRPPRRIRRQHLIGLALGIAGELRGNRPRLHFHHLNAKRRQLQAQCVAQGMHGGLGRAVGAGERRYQHPRDAADINHQPACTAQQREQCAGHPDNREDIGLELLAQGIDAAVEQRPHGAVAGVVDQDVEGFKLLGQTGQGLAVVHIQLPGAEAGGVQALDILSFAGGSPDVVAGIAEGVGQGAADAAGTTGDQDGGHV